MNHTPVLILVLGIIFCSACSSQPPSTDKKSSEPPPMLINIEGEPIEGDPAAKVIVVEFIDYQCPICGRHEREVMPQLKTNYLDTGKVAYVSMDFPLERSHSLAFQAAEAANCAADQGRFWEMHNLLLLRQNALEEDDLFAHALELSLDISRFQDCMVTNKHASAIRSDLEEGKSLNVTGTPIFFLCVPEPDQPGYVRVVSVIRGGGVYNNFRWKLEIVLKSILRSNVLASALSLGTLNLE